MRADTKRKMPVDYGGREEDSDADDEEEMKTMASERIQVFNSLSL